MFTVMTERKTFSVVAVTGAYGYIGTQVLQRLVKSEEFEKVVCIDLRQGEIELPNRFVFRACDIRDGEKIQAIFQTEEVDTVLHLAFIANPTRNTQMEYDVDVVGMQHVLDAVTAVGVRKLVVASSDCVYGFFEDGCDGLCEKDPTRPTPGFCYAENKVIVESMVSSFSETHPECAVVVLRPCIVTGPHMNNAFGKSLRQPVIVRIRGYDPSMQFIHEEDVAEAFYLALVRDAEGIFNLAVDEGVRLSEMARIAGKPMLPLPAWFLYPLIEGLYQVGLMKFGSSQLDYIRYPMSMNAEKIREELGFCPRYTSREALESFRSDAEKP
jgi:UDP-glucose 4-epimerase